MDDELIRRYVLEAVSAGSSYMKKEAVKQRLQAILEEAIAVGDISSPEELKDWWATIEMATMSLKSVPFLVWEKKLSG